MKYRLEIDGLRAVSVIAVVFFHAGVTLFSGGFVGVDVFFVISGYLITGLVYDEIKSGKFTFGSFYKRRAARLLPALCTTLAITLLFGFFFYDGMTFDKLGKELFFSSFGAVNILFAQGVDYFASDASVRPLLHLWSLGVEEQFYLIWPLLLIGLVAVANRYLLIVIPGILALSLYYSSTTMFENQIHAYFLPQYRAFELLIGAFVAISDSSGIFQEENIKHGTKEILSFLGLLAIFLPIFMFDKNTAFPGYRALLPCLGTALIITFSKGAYLAKFLSNKTLVTTGLISYPLYMYHQPFISFLRYFDVEMTAFQMAMTVFAVTIPLAWLTYHFIETPIRKSAHQISQNSGNTIGFMVVILMLIAVTGLSIAKNDGWVWRFKILNPFAYDVSHQNEESFRKNYIQGFNVAENKEQKILFIGDSVLQQYVLPLSLALNVGKSDVDTVTRGGCILLKNVDFRDEFFDVSCSDIREKLYASKKHYGTVIISQHWDAYDTTLMNSGVSKSDPEYFLKKWNQFIEDTVDYFMPLSDRIIILGEHPLIGGTKSLKPTIFLRKEGYLKNLSHLTITNFEELNFSRQYMTEHWRYNKNVFVLQPQDIWCEHALSPCTLHDGKWSFFRDEQHVSNASTQYLTNRLRKLLKNLIFEK